MLQMPRESYAEALVSGEADLAIGYLPVLRAGFYQSRLFTDSYVCLVRSDHPRIKGRLSRAQLMAESHVVIERGGSRYLTTSHQTSSTTWIEQELARRGLSRRIVLRVPHFMGVPEIVQATDLIGLVPSYVLRQLDSKPNLRMLQLPLDLPRFTVKQYWHERKHEDTGNRWLRGVISAMFRQA